MIKRYIFPSEEIANNLISELNLQGGTTNCYICGIVKLGFQDEHEYSEEIEDSVLIKKATTYNVDVFWRDEALNTWKMYEITPKTPSHEFA